jgi:hypothetical protein
MGRPIKKKFFGNLNNEQYGNVGTGSGIGGESVASVSISNTGTLYSQGTTITFSAPQLPTGVTATGHPVFTTDGNSGFGITSIVIDNAGRGYTSAPTLTVTTASVVTQYVTNSGVTATNTMSVASVVGIQIGMRVYGGGNGGLVTAVDPVLNRVTSSLPNSTSWTNANNLKFYDQGSGFAKTVTLTSTTTNALTVNAYLLAKDGGAGIKASDIVKQEASKRYLVKNTDGIGQCALVASDTPAAGQMNITATDALNSTYWVTKLTARRCTLVRRSNGGSGYSFADGATAGWNITAAATGVVKLGSA